MVLISANNAAQNGPKIISITATDAAGNAAIPLTIGVDLQNRADGAGFVSLSSAAPAITAGSTKHQLIFQFTAAETMDGGAISITMPDGWSLPQGEPEKPGYTIAISTGSIGTLLFTGAVVTVPINTLGVNQTITVVIGAGNGISGVSAQPNPGEAKFIVKSRVSPTGKLVELQSGSPVVIVEPSPSSQPEFDLLIPAGISLIHLPLKVTEVNGEPIEIQTIGDLYEILGPANVTFIITRDVSARVWRSYLGPQSRGTPADQPLIDDLGLIPVMNNTVMLRLKGEALGTDGVSTIHLNRGINFIGVPLKDARLERVSDLLSLEGMKDNVTSIIVSDGGQFKVVTQSGSEGDIPLTGGQAFIITARASSAVEITGVAWNNVSGEIIAAPPLPVVGHTVDQGTPVLAVYGTVVDEATGLAKNGFRVTVKNLSTGTFLNTVSGHDGPEGGYSVTFVDPLSGHAARIGDILEITAQTPSPLIGVQPLRHIVSVDEVSASQIRLPDLIAYSIPKETMLLPNYPNPFNPETWIPFRLAEDSKVTLTIYDMKGVVVRTIQVGQKPAAAYESKEKAVYWDGRNDFGEHVASGVYFYRLTANGFSGTRKMLLLK